MSERYGPTVGVTEKQLLAYLSGRISVQGALFKRGAVNLLISGGGMGRAKIISIVYASPERAAFYREILLGEKAALDPDEF